MIDVVIVDPSKSLRVKISGLSELLSFRVPHPEPLDMKLCRRSTETACGLEIFSLRVVNYT